jgi:HYR domain
VATPTQKRRRGRFSLILGVLAAMIALAAVAYAADIQTDADLSTSLLSPTQVSIGDNGFTIKVWAIGNLNNPSATGQATIVNKYFMATNGTITPSANVADRTTLTFTKNVNYSQNPPCGSTQATSIQGCPNNPFIVNANLVVASGTPDNTTGTVTVSNTGSTGLNADPTPDTGAVQVDAGDTTPPTLHLPANMTGLEATSSAGRVVFFAPTADDIAPAHPTVTCVPASGSTFGLGTTTVNCSATDTAGNEASGSFAVEVVDTTPPVLTLPSDITAEATGPSGAAVSYSASASDLVSSVVVSCSPASGSTFVLGTTPVDCSATDAAGNLASDSFAVTVVDTTPPTLSLPANMTVEATGASGAVVTYSASASDLVDGSVPVNCSPASGSTFALDVTTTVNCAATDATGNTANDSFTVKVVDTTGPALNLPSDITTTASSNSQKIVTYTASANDLVDGPVSITCLPASGSSFPVGQTTVNCSATDSHGNTSNGSFKIQVNYSFGGFFQPIDNGVLNKAKAGSAIPVKFSLSGDQGLNIFMSGYPTSAQVSCGNTATADLVEETVTAGQSTLNYDATSGQYIYVWKTQSAWGNSCRTLTVKLKDGTTIKQANFWFPK